MIKVSCGRNKKGPGLKNDTTQTTDTLQTTPIDADLARRIIERVQKIPVFDKLGMRIEALYPRRCVAIVPHDKAFDGIFNSYHGGMLMTAADTIACFAMMTET